MRMPRAPKIETRREADFEAELMDRAHTWVPSWALGDDDNDFGRALIRIAARFSSEVAERLDRCGDKMWRGFFDWLATPRNAARAARMPVVFKMADGTPAPVPAVAPVRLQASAPGASVVFETEGDVEVIPGTIASVVGTDADNDQIFLQVPGLTSVEPADPSPSQWQLESFAPANATMLQLNPTAGLAVDLIVETAGQQYRVAKVDNDIATIDPPVAAAAGLAAGTVLTKVTSFEPFNTGVIDRQEHAVYLGDENLLNIDDEATIDVIGGEQIGANVQWTYWGKVYPKDDVGWQPLLPVAMQPPGAVRLSKRKGSIEPRPIGEVQSSRWLRAYTKTVTGDRPAMSVQSLELSVNADSKPKCPLDPGTPSTTLDAVGMANTTPLVLSEAFYPLGKAPRQFDAFYLGSPEVFSKPGASVHLCFQLADTSFKVLSAVTSGAYANAVLAGVGQDGALHLLFFDQTQGTISKFLGRDALQPPLPGFQGSAVATPTVMLDQSPTWRLPVWTADIGSLAESFLVAMAAGAHIWVWQEVVFDSSQSGWVDCLTLPSSSAVRALVFLEGAPRQLAALQDDGTYSLLSLAAISSGWTSTPTTLMGGAGITLKTIAPVLDGTSGSLVSSAADGMVGVDGNNALYAVPTAGTPCSAISTGPIQISFDVQPVSLVGAPNPAVVAADLSLTQFVAVAPNGTVTPMPLPPGTAPVIATGSLDAILDGSSLCVVSSVFDPPNAYLATWTPGPATNPKCALFTVDIPTAAGEAGGDPTVLGNYVVVPGKHADILVAGFDLAQRLSLSENVGAGLVVPNTIPALGPGDLVTTYVGGAYQERHIVGTGVSHGNEIFYPLDSSFPPGATGFVAYQYATVGGLSGTTSSPPPNTLNLASTDHSAVDSSRFYVEVTAGGSIYRYESGITPPINKTSSQWAVTLSTSATVQVGAAQYWPGIQTNGREAPFFEVAPADRNWDAGLLDHADLLFPPPPPANVADPWQQTAQAFSVDLQNHPILVVMGTDWNTPPAAPAQIVLNAAVGSWTKQLGDNSSNPDLSWEYWNGAWSKLPIDLDQTLNLKSSGLIKFEVPQDVASTDWAGKTSYWIRARLVGGDYGTETVTVITTPLSGGGTQQTVVRSTDGIQPPLVVSLSISYNTDPALPEFVLAEDSLSIRDESDANRAGAIVEGFVPLGVMLGRLQAGSGSSVPIAEAGCPPECDCSGASAAAVASSASGASTPGVAQTAAPVVPATGRSLFLGATAPLSGAPVNVLFLVDQEHDHTAFAPLTADALVGGRFIPLVRADQTRALGETGLLELTFPESPTQAELFGQSLFWVRVGPFVKSNVPATGWTPSLKGVYLNAAWASATETMTRELVGSSAGAPNLTLSLARPPLLQGTLELRVLEPLGQEERTALLQADPASVLNDPNLPGDWVLWKQVIDPGDEDATARVYSLDEATGHIQFGDGLHGAIPPIGDNSIVAFRYQRTEPPAPGAIDVPGNLIEARAQVGLASPVNGVEAVFSADHAAGGAPPEPDDRVLRDASAKLRHRGRAVTARDLEDLTLASSPDIAQARALGGGQKTTLVVVMKGSNPSPSMAQRRELGRLLLTLVPSAFAAAGALNITGPAVRLLRIKLQLLVDRLDFAGALGQDVEARVRGFLDPVSGGIAQAGWPLGASPREEDVAFALLDATHLESIEAIELVEVLDDGNEGTWPVALKAGELAQLAADGIRIQFDSAEALA